MFGKASYLTDLPQSDKKTSMNLLYTTKLELAKPGNTPFTGRFAKQVLRLSMVR
ncbi:hypothetical protein R50073_50070 (plasmid) [Maricurvus nonylphenolicus]